MVWRWQGGGIDTTVRFDLSPEREGTRLKLTHAGFRDVGSVLISVYGSGSSTRSSHAEAEDEEVRC
jgi:hypothetical protein